MKNKLPSVAVHTIGCRLNRYESDGIMQRFVESGRYRTADSDEKPDITIINTCTVTDRADHTNRSTIRKFARNNPAGKIIVTGCFAETDPEKVVDLDVVDLVIDNKKKSKLFQIVDAHLNGEVAPAPLFSSSDTDRFDYGSVVPHGHVRAYLKIQDGCNRTCSYCKIPQARGRGVSRDSDDVIAAALELEERGYREIVLTGVNLGWYREKNSNTDFTALLARLLDRLSRARLRLSSIEPCDVDERLAELILHPRFCSFLHVPLQSGSRDVLRRMKRTYTPQTFRTRIERVLAKKPDLFLGTDVMVGFPGERDADFEQTLQLCRDLPFAKLHIFPFSRRSGTPAATFPDQLSADVIRSRVAKLEEVDHDGWLAYAKRQIGTVRIGIVENPRKEREGFGRALTDNFLSLSFRAGVETEVGHLVPFRLERIGENQRILASPVETSGGWN